MALVGLSGVFTGRGGWRLRPGMLFAFLLAEAVALFVIRLPATLQFDRFAFSDTGANLTEQYLLDERLRPIVDFVYIYGLLSLAANRVWFALFGRTVLAAVAAIPVGDILLAWGLVRFARALELNLVGSCTLLLAAPFIIPSNYLHLTHLIEPVLLCHALAAQAKGRRSTALALATVCVFVKPSMAYLYGLILISWMIRLRYRERARLRDLVADLTPAVLTAASIATILALEFGIVPVSLSLLPVGGFRIYAALGFGFFGGRGRLFWDPSGASIAYYATNVAGPWLAASLLLFAAAIAAARTLHLEGGDEPYGLRSAELVVTCALLHLGFISLFFGNQHSWPYYVILLTLGLSAASALGLGWSIGVAVIAVAMPGVRINRLLLEHFEQRGRTEVRVRDRAVESERAPRETDEGFDYGDYGLWFSSAPHKDTAGLWAPALERGEWERVLEMIRGHRTALLEWFGCADTLFPQFSSPVTDLLVSGVDSGADIARKVAQIHESTMIVMPRWQKSLLSTSPKIGAEVDRDFSVIWQGRYFIVFGRHSAEQGIRREKSL
jgi:hypothetical protein